MSEPRRHHLVPQMHLKRFADHKRRIAMVSRDQKKHVSIDIKKACVQTDFYTVETANGRTQEVEELLSTVESDAAVAFERMLSGEFPPSPADREAVALFIGFQCLRGDDAREGYEQVTNMLAKLMLANATTPTIIEVFRQKEGRDPTPEEIAAQKHTLKSLDNIVIKPHQNESINNMLSLAPKIATHMLQRRWLLVDHGEPCLLTSDTPVAKFTKPTKSFLHRGNGWATADEVQFPLSPRHTLALSNNLQSEERTYNLGCKLGPEMAAQINWRIAFNARRWIFHHPGTTPLKGIELPPPGPIFTMEGPTGRIIPEEW